MGYKKRHGCLYVYRSGIIWKKYDGDENFYTEPLDLTKSIHRRFMQAIKENTFKNGTHLNMHTDTKLKDDDYFKDKNWLMAEKTVDEIICSMLSLYCLGRIGESSDKIGLSYSTAERKLQDMVNASPNAEKAISQLKGILADMMTNLTSNEFPTSEYVSLDDAKNLIDKKHMVVAVNASQVFVDLKADACIKKKNSVADKSVLQDENE